MGRKTGEDDSTKDFKKAVKAVVGGGWGVHGSERPRAAVSNRLSGGIGEGSSQDHSC
jgi:hypothetical protein